MRSLLEIILFVGTCNKKDSFLLLVHLNNITADKMLLPNMKRRLKKIFPIFILI